MTYFFDTSALVKIYHREQGTKIVSEIYDQEKYLIISELTRVEFLTTLYKKYRNKEISREALQITEEDFLSDLQSKLIVVKMISTIIDSAINLIQSVGLKSHIYTLDAIQLVSFLEVAQSNTIFVCTDRKLNKIVTELGYQIIEPK